MKNLVESDKDLSAINLDFISVFCDLINNSPLINNSEFAEKLKLDNKENIDDKKIILQNNLRDIAKNKTIIENLEVEIADIEGKIQSNQNENIELQNKIPDLQNNVKILLDSLKNSTKTFSKSNIYYSCLKSEVELLDEQTNKNESDSKLIKEEIDKMEQKQNNLKQNINELNEKRLKTKKEKDQLKETCEEIENSINETETQISSLENTKNQLSQKEKDLKSKLKESESNIEFLNDEENKKRDSIEELTSEYERISEEHADKQTMVTEMSKKEERLRNNIETLLEEINSLESKVEDLGKSFVDSESQIDQLLEEKLKQKDKERQLRNERDFLLKQKSSLEGEVIHNIKYKIENNKNEVEQITSEIAKLSDELSAYKKELESIRNDTETKKRNLEQIRHERFIVKSERDAEISYLKIITQELTNIKSQIASKSENTEEYEKLKAEYSEKIKIKLQNDIENQNILTQIKIYKQKLLQFQSKPIIPVKKSTKSAERHTRSFRELDSKMISPFEEEDVGEKEVKFDQLLFEINEKVQTLNESIDFIKVDVAKIYRQTDKEHTRLNRFSTDLDEPKLEEDDPNNLSNLEGSRIAELQEYLITEIRETETKLLTEFQILKNIKDSAVTNNAQNSDIDNFVKYFQDLKEFIDKKVDLKSNTGTGSSNDIEDNILSNQTQINNVNDKIQSVEEKLKEIFNLVSENNESKQLLKEHLITKIEELIKTNLKSNTENLIESISSQTKEDKNNLNESLKNSLQSIEENNKTLFVEEKQDINKLVTDMIELKNLILDTFSKIDSYQETKNNNSSERELNRENLSVEPAKNSSELYYPKLISLSKALIDSSSNYVRVIAILLKRFGDFNTLSSNKQALLK